MIKHLPKVSVIIPAYNQSTYLGFAIQSVLDQTYQDFEILVIDDGSTDNTTEIAQSFSDQRLKYVYQINKGLSGARNTGIKISCGEYLTFLDSDDMFLPKNLELLSGFLDTHTGIGLVAGQMLPMDEQGKLISKDIDNPDLEDSTKLLLGNPLQVGTMMVRRTWLERSGFFDESLRSCEDWDMWLRLARNGCNMGWVAEPVFLYRFHRDQMIRHVSQMTHATFAVLDKHFADPTLPEEWHTLHDIAYCNANLRAAMRAYNASDFSDAQAYMLEASRLHPDLIADDAQLFAHKLASFAGSPKNSNPILFLETIYNHLPAEFAVLRRRRGKDIGQVALEVGFRSFYLGEYRAARVALLRALWYQPAILKNRGVLSMLIRSSLPFFNASKKTKIP